MKIIKLQASNIKKLTAISITPDGHVVTLAGDNGAGKSSVLDAIAYALGGTSDVCEQPIRRGASNAEVICELDGLIVTRRFTATGTTLKVENAEGTQRSPQALLDTLVGNLAFDPLEFSRRKPTEQAETLRKLVGINFDALDAEKTRIYNERLLLGREADVLKGKVTGYNPIPGVPSIDINSIFARKNAAIGRNQANAEARAKLSNIRNLVERNKVYSDALFARIAELENQLSEAKESFRKVNFEYNMVQSSLIEQEKLVVTLKDEDVTVFDKEAIEATEQNKIVRQNQLHEEHMKEWRAKSAQYDKATEDIDSIEIQKKKLLSEAKFPLPELSFSEDGGVTYNGFPFSQASDGEKLRVSVAIGMALNPKLRVIFIRDGSLLDKHGLQTIAELAVNNNYQVWIEDARSSDPTSVVIEDGHVKQQN